MSYWIVILTESLTLSKPTNDYIENELMLNNFIKVIQNLCLVYRVLFL